MTSVTSGLSVFNALVFSQWTPAMGGTAAPMTLLLNGNITMKSSAWYWSRGLTVSRNTTMRGQLGSLTVIDFEGASSYITVAPGVMFVMENVHLLNIAPLRGSLSDLGILPIFGLPVWFFNISRSPVDTQITLRNATFTLTQSEYIYFTLWALVVTTDVATVSEQAQLLKSATSIVKLGTAPNRDSINFAQLRGVGLDLYNFSITAAVPSGFMNSIPDNPNLQFSLTVPPDITQLAVYNLDDLIAVLRSVQDTKPQYATALFILRNITIDSTRAGWPADGFKVSSPVLFVGQNNFGIPTWIDFQRVPKFLVTSGCAPDMYVFSQGLWLANLPNAMAQAGSPQPSGSAVPGTHLGAGLSDVSIYVTNIQALNTLCPAPMFYMNQSTISVTFSEFRQVYNDAVKHLGTTMNGSGMVLGTNIDYNLTSVLLTGVTYQDLIGWGWHGFKTEVTYRSPPGVVSLYNNTFEPLSPSASSAPIVRSANGGGGDGNDSLAGWQVALIVVGCVLFVALIGVVIYLRTVKKLKQEVEAVKSGASDKKSSNNSGEAETATANGGRLAGSSHPGGSSQHPATGSGNAPHSPAVKAIAGATGGMNGEGTSDDSSAPPVDRPPLEVLNAMMASLTAEMDDQHLRILEVIGQGGFGVVYKGQWKGLNVAVKTITFQDRVAGGEKAQHRAILEAAISSSLAHPNVVTTYSYDIKPMTVQGASSTDSPGSGTGANGTPGLKIVDKRPVLDWKLYLVQEYCDGGSLRMAILKRKFFDAKKDEPRMEMILDTSIELCGGLVHLHERNIVHGDLNPNNVLLKRDATKKYGAVCKIADFGLSIKMNADQSHISNMRRGTPFYTCPQILARGNMTKAADVYSMGVMIWEMYHSCMSYRSLPSGFAARESFPKFPRKAPHEFARVVGMCLDPEPAQRPTFVQLKELLEAQLVALKQGTLRSGEEVLGPDPAGDAAHMAYCQD
ncbi:hypothetical protein HYH02_000782 [Chlamydomonas schloesseri]|uniref:Protein kinase domain-containing protein n=1 Tax=Chlamydomonas schloesseri TaxID=2026947 RepID=A0A836BDT3_9CHLO|nr:hypothetical protein HYH02_000782 [Chlamydomonas schloesseri]|eukprot:KAG2454955.1 hypothetical protein HYH02_000782 [Chlamydomonas schloesseri]